MADSEMSLVVKHRGDPMEKNFATVTDWSWGERWFQITFADGGTWQSPASDIEYAESRPKS